MKDARDAEPLTRDELSRMTLSRQHLLRSADVTDVELAEHLIGLQAQNPWSWYVGFFRRADGIRPETVSSALAERRLVRMSTMRATIHLLTPSDAASLRAHTQVVHDRTLSSGFGRDLRGVNLKDIAAEAREVLEAAPHTLKELGTILGRRRSDIKPGSLAMAVRFQLPLVQVVPRGEWGRSGPIAYTTLENWVGAPAEPHASIREIILRYLAAFGPASVMDFQAWSGLTRCRIHFDGLRDVLTTYRTADAQTLFDITAVDRTSMDSHVPVRFLYDYDNLLLAYRDRSRFITPRYVAMQRELDGTTLQAVLVHGRTAAIWTHRADSESITVEVSLLEHLAESDLDEVEQEAITLATWLDPQLNPQVTIDRRWYAES